MDRLPIFLNELSCALEGATTPQDLLRIVLTTLGTLKAVRNLRPDVLLACHVPISRILLGRDSQPLGALFRGPERKDAWRFVASLDQTSPWGAYPGAKPPGHLRDVRHGDSPAIGLTWAYVNDSAVLSFGFPPDWDRDWIRARSDELNDQGDVHSVAVEVRNLAAPPHVECHRDALTTYGADVSTSTIIYEAIDYKLRMYFLDHPPPHFHVMVNSGAKAKCDIQTLDIIAGQLPSGIHSEIKRWARVRRDALIANWDRCRSGNHPLVLE